MWRRGGSGWGCWQVLAHNVFGRKWTHREMETKDLSGLEGFQVCEMQLIELCIIQATLH